MENAMREESLEFTATTHSSGEGRPEPQISRWRLVSLYVRCFKIPHIITPLDANCVSKSICFGLFLSFLDTSIVATALYKIGVDFQSLSSVNWVALAYTLAYLGCTAIFASLSGT
jgi:hypothetical protein